MLKLQLKLIIYNAITKGSVILIIGMLIFIFLDDLSYRTLDSRLKDKAENFITHVTQEELNLLLADKKNITDFNALKEEYVTVKLLPNQDNKLQEPVFETQQKVLVNENSTYRSIKQPFIFRNKNYQIEIGLSLVNIARLKETIIYIVVLAVFLALSIGLILDILYSRIIFNPFYKIIDKKINNVNDPQNYNHQLIKTSTKDFRILDESIGSLITKINNVILKEKQFIANVSHELLTPVSILTARFENILHQDDLDEVISKKLYASIKTLNRLKSVINSLLLISKIENHQFKKPNKVILNTLINDVIEELEDRCVEKEIVVTNNMKYNFLILVNETLIQTLFFNVINNAIKYNVKHGAVTIKDKTSNEFYSIYVKDTGVGIDAEKINLAFNRFEQLNTDQQDSHGLGLAIVKSIAQFHQAELEIQSELGKGFTFIIKFRLEDIQKV